MKSHIILHLHSLASGGNYLQNFFEHYSETLEQNSIYYRGTEIEGKFQVKNHQYIFNSLIGSLQQGKAYKNEHIDILESWRKEILLGNNILISYRPQKLYSSLQDVKSVLRSYPDLRDCKLKFFVTTSRHDHMFEESCRRNISLKPQTLYDSILSFGTCAQLHDGLCQQCCEKDFRLLFFPNSPIQFNESDFSILRKEFLKFCNMPTCIGENFHPSAIYSEFSLRFMHLLLQMTNDYQKPNIQEVFEELCNSEKSLHFPSFWISDPEKRKKLYNLFHEDWKKSSIFSIKQPDNISYELESLPPPLLIEQAEKLTKRISPKLITEIKKYLSHEYLHMNDQQKQIYSLFIKDYRDIEVSEIHPRLSILTMTRNQENFIGSCLQSVIDQQCSFPIQHIVVDDFSTDNTRNIILKFAHNHPHIIPILLDRKVYFGESVKALFQRCRTEYAALCDGDDYFTDPAKLQTQVDFLDQHKDCALCFHPVKVVYEDDSKQERIYPPVEQLPRGIKPFYYLSDLLKCNLIQTNSVVYRWRFRNGLPEWFRPDCCPGDWYWHLLHAELGKIGFINKIMSVYRRHKKGIYYLSEVDRLKHRATVGEKEIEVYDIINKHFDNKYKSILLDLVNGVFADCLMYDSSREQDVEFKPVLPTLVEKYPDFARHFLGSLKLVSAKNTPVA